MMISSHFLDKILYETNDRNKNISTVCRITNFLLLIITRMEKDGNVEINNTLPITIGPL